VLGKVASLVTAKEREGGRGGVFGRVEKGGLGQMNDIASTKKGEEAVRLFRKKSQPIGRKKEKGASSRIS